MQNLERRICALESASPSVEERTFVVRFIAAGDPGAEIDGLRTNEGRQWARMPGESEQGLIDRATREVGRNQLGAALLLSRVEQEMQP